MQISKRISEKTNRFFLAFHFLRVIYLVSVTYKNLCLKTSEIFLLFDNWLVFS